MSKALIFNEISRILACNSLFLTEQGKQEFLAELFLIEKQGGYYSDEDIPTYAETSKKVAEKLATETNIPLTVDYQDANLESDAVAYYRIKGMIMGESSWWFSTKQFNEDLQAAEANPMIMSHFIHANSGGGDTWFLDEAWKTMMNLKKPVVTVIERVGASACIYLVCASKKIYAATVNEVLGSVGTMVSFFDIVPYFEAQGIKKIEEYATKSDLKNKKFNNLLNGKPQQFITEELDPLQQQFEAAVRKARPKAGVLEEKHPLFRGETYATQTAIDIGLIDGQKLFADALMEAYDLGQKYIAKNRSALRYLNSNYK